MKNGKQEKILKAAEKVFLKKGFYPTRIEDIAERANIAKGTVYLYFPDKTSIYIALLDNHLSEAIKLLKIIKKEKSSATKKMELIFDEGFELVDHVKGMMTLVSIENINLTAELMKEIKANIWPKIRKIIDLVAEIIRDGIKQKEIRNMDPKLGALIFFSMVRASFISPIFVPELKEQSEKIKEIFFYGIKPNKK
jgi:TetR/AcrR family fatty acid metabolism transcriptional regulator